jgi:small subunit ribosomal protein S6
MRERRRDYELMFIISPLHTSEEEIAATISRVHQSITAAGGTVSNTEHSAPWGRRKFAYPIYKHVEAGGSRQSFTEGFYVLCHFNLPTSSIPEVERTLKLNLTVLRYLLTLVDERGQGIAAGSSISIGSDADDEDIDADEIDEDDDYETEDEASDDE